MQTLMLTVEYDGTRYAGWKAAPKKENLDNGLGENPYCSCQAAQRGHTVILCRKNRPWCSCKRQILSFQTTSSLLPSALKSSLNQVLPQDIAVLDARQVSERFSCRITPQTLYLGALYQNRFDS